MFIACCVTLLCHAPVRIGVYVAGGGTGCTCAHVECRRSHRDGVGPCGSMTVSTGDMPRVLLQVTPLCRRGVAFRACFAVGFLNCMMARALVSQRIVMIGAASITLCSARVPCIDQLLPPFVLLREVAGPTAGRYNC
jgi:hypothetical protein